MGLLIRSYWNWRKIDAVYPSSRGNDCYLWASYSGSSTKTEVIEKHKDSARSEIAIKAETLDNEALVPPKLKRLPTK